MTKEQKMFENVSVVVLTILSFWFVALAVTNRERLVGPYRTEVEVLKAKCEKLEAENEEQKIYNAVRLRSGDRVYVVVDPNVAADSRLNRRRQGNP